jgi:hypothetical protein
MIPAPAPAAGIPEIAPDLDEPIPTDATPVTIDLISLASGTGASDKPEDRDADALPGMDLIAQGSGAAIISSDPPAVSDQNPEDLASPESEKVRKVVEAFASAMADHDVELILSQMGEALTFDGRSMDKLRMRQFFEMALDSGAASVDAYDLTGLVIQSGPFEAIVKDLRFSLTSGQTLTIGMRLQREFDNWRIVELVP